MNVNSIASSSSLWINCQLQNGSSNSRRFFPLEIEVEFVPVKPQIRHKKKILIQKKIFKNFKVVFVRKYGVFEIIFAVGKLLG